MFLTPQHRVGYREVWCKPPILGWPAAAAAAASAAPPPPAAVWTLPPRHARFGPVPGAFGCRPAGKVYGGAPGRGWIFLPFQQSWRRRNSRKLNQKRAKKQRARRESWRSTTAAPEGKDQQVTYSSSSRRQPAAGAWLWLQSQLQTGDHSNRQYNPLPTLLPFQQLLHRQWLRQLNNNNMGHNSRIPQHERRGQ